MQRNLLDTHTFIWFVNGDKSLSQTARQRIEADGATNFIIVASLWEIAIKVSLGKLALKTPFHQISNQIAVNGFELLPVTFEDTLLVSKLPFHHRDPFDRILIAQAINNQLTILSKDNWFALYGAKLSW
jgi:PIN domain nuclease of toxin-antitoxin system